VFSINQCEFAQHFREFKLFDSLAKVGVVVDVYAAAFQLR